MVCNWQCGNSNLGQSWEGNNTEMVQEGGTTEEKGVRDGTEL